ncbi:MAG: DegQ family serine endoprotease [Rhabdochlamydiaceae bacterium]|nr:DegQ family serine endoprotease [Rhabdochlamydiaceae bacterium]
MKYLTLIATSLLITAPMASNEKPSSCQCSTKGFSKMFTPVAKKAMPASVFLRVEINPADNENFGQADPYGNPFGDDFLNKFFGFPPGGRQMPPQTQVGQGSGFIVSADGLIMTNNHVVRGADKIEVTLNDGQVRPAKLLGTDPRTDLALVKIEKIDGQDFPFLELGDSEKLEVGEWVIAIGNPFQLQASVTAGVISALGRQGLKITDQEDFIQTDAAINPGNSGGPLLNLEGKVIGINTAIASRSGGYMGIGFAIPSNMARYVMDQLVQKGSVTRGFLGIELQTVDKEIAEGFNLPKAEGVLITSVAKNSPAEKAGLQTGDIILELNGKAVKSRDTFRNQISMMDPNSEAKLKVFRKGKMIPLTVKLGSISEEAATPAVVSQKLGIEVENLTAELARQLGYSAADEGVVITKVKPGSPASLAGLRPGCLIQAINHKKVSNTSDYEDAIAENGQNKRILLLVKYGKTTRFYSIRIE